MANPVNKQRVLNQLLTLGKKRYEPAEPEPRPVFEQFVYAICREGVTREKADRAYRQLQECFFDWNEIRVSSVREVEEVLAGLPHAEARASRLISYLQEVFETTYSFDLESLHKKGLKQAARHLARFQAANDYTVAWVVQQSLGGHAIPLDDPTVEILHRLGLLEESEDNREAMRGSLEHLVPKAKGWMFVDIVSDLAHDTTWEEEPDFPFPSLVLEGAGAVSGSESRTMTRVARSRPR